mgnify:FL=1
MDALAVDEGIDPEAMKGGEPTAVAVAAAVAVTVAVTVTAETEVDEEAKTAMPDHLVVTGEDDDRLFTKMMISRKMQLGWDYDNDGFDYRTSKTFLLGSPVLASTFMLPVVWICCW